MLVGRNRSAQARARAVLGALTLTLLAACGPERLEKAETDLQEAIAEALTRGDTATLRVFIEVPFAFDRLYIAGPRTPEATIGAAMGGEWDPTFSRAIETSDHFHLFIFDVRGEYYPVAVPRRIAEVDSALTGRLYGPETAVFRVRRPPGATVPTLLPR